MPYGNHGPEVKKKYPDYVIQAFTDKWWETDESDQLRRGRLIRAFIPYIDQEPMILIPEGRTSPTEHSRINYLLQPLQFSKTRQQPKLPVAALPSFSKEIRTVYRAKERPALVISSFSSVIPIHMKKKGAPWQYKGSNLIVPIYGAEASDSRAGWNPEFVERVKKCEYPEYMWDLIPSDTGSSFTESILRFDQLQPVGNDAKNYKLCSHCLTKEALKIIDEWLYWVITGYLSVDDILFMFRKEMNEIDHT